MVRRKVLWVFGLALICSLLSPLSAEAREFNEYATNKSGDYYCTAEKDIVDNDDKPPSCWTQCTEKTEKGQFGTSGKTYYECSKKIGTAGKTGEGGHPPSSDTEETTEEDNGRGSGGTTPAEPEEPADDTPSGGVQFTRGPDPGPADINNVKDPDGAAGRTECAIPGFFGTFICRFTDFFGKIADASFNMLTAFMEIPAFSTTTGANNNRVSATYSAWSLFRGIANAIFAVIFLIVIYSYITGIGVSTYSIKRMLPRMIVGVILVNLSFYISAIAVDLSNILGTTLFDLMKAFTSSTLDMNRTNTGTFQTLVGNIMFVAAHEAGGFIVGKYATVSFFLPIIVTTLISVLTTVIVLLLRQVFAIIFVIISPLAFAAMILPSTANYFAKFRKVSVAMLLVFPAVSLMFGAGYMASQVIGAVGGAGPFSVSNTLLMITSAGVQVVPLFFVPAVMKLGGGLLNRVAGVTNTPAAKANKWAENRAKISEQRGEIKALAAHQADKESKANGGDGVHISARQRRRINRMKREAKANAASKGAEVASEGYIEDLVSGKTGTQEERDAFLAKLAVSDDKQLQNRAKNKTLHAKMKAHADTVQVMAHKFENEHTPYSTVRELAIATEEQRKNGVVDELVQEAAILKLAQAGDIGAILDIVKHSSNLTIEQRSTLVKVINQSVAKSVPFLANPQAQEAIMQGVVSDDSSFQQHVVAPSLETDDYSASKYADMDQDAARAIHETIEAGKVSTKATEVHKEAAKKALDIEDTRNRLTKSKQWVEKIAK